MTVHRLEIGRVVFSRTPSGSADGELDVTCVRGNDDLAAPSGLIRSLGIHPGIDYLPVIHPPCERNTTCGLRKFDAHRDRVLDARGQFPVGKLHGDNFSRLMP